MGLADSMKKHPVFSGTVFLLLLLISWIGYFFYTFDLNDYRQQLQDRLSSHLSLPVHLGNASVKLRGAGPAISFTDVSIGDETTFLALETSDLWLMLEWSALLRQQLDFSKIGMRQPDLRITIPPGSFDSEAARNSFEPLLIDGALLSDFSIQSLEISEGRLQLELPASNGQSRTVELRQMGANLTDLARGQAVGLNVTATVPGQGETATLNLKGNVEVPHDLVSWQKSTLDLTIDLTDLNGTTLDRLLLPALPTAKIAGAANLTSQFSGSAAEGLTVSVKLQGKDLTFADRALPDAYAVQHFETTGVFTWDDQRGRLRNMVISLNEMQLNGETVWYESSAGPKLEAEISQGIIPFASLAELLPERTSRFALIDREGSFRIKQGNVALSFSGPQGKNISVERFDVDAALHDLAWQMNPSLRLTVSGADIQGRKQVWTLSRGQGSLGPISVALEGQLDFSAKPAPALDLGFAGTTSITEIFALAGDDPDDPAKVSGPLSFRTRLSGSPGQINLDIDADLSAVEGTLPAGRRLPPEPGSQLNLHGKLQNTALQIEHVQLQRPPFTVKASGWVDWTQQTEIDIEGRVELSQAAKLEDLLPALKPYDISGRANLEFTLAGPLTDPRRTAMLSLGDIGFSTRGVTAPISRLQGRLQLTEEGFASEKMLARIGDSAVSFTARLKDFSAPELLLDIQADRVNADDLIFPADQMHLLDLRGQLRITPERVAFAPIRVRLPDGTRARIEGTATGRPDLQVDLDITSEFANVREVIGLWTRMSPEARQKWNARKREKPGKPRQPHRLEIQAQAEQGDLYGMHFESAAATIGHQPGQLLIHPLNFRVDGGHALAQVIVDFRSPAQPLLRVSGHTEEIDAHRIYNELLDQDSVLRGSLRGDFYLQGELGKNYLSSSFGNFDIEVREGVLRKFHVLSKIFSLLNVSQILALELPDMDTEGMPFDSISGSLTMDQGVLSTENLLVKSEAMNQSYIGRMDLVDKTVNFKVAVQPLGTVDKVLSRIPVAGWLLTGKEKALITTHFSVEGQLPTPDVDMEPVTSVSEKTLGLIRRTLGLPMKLVTDPSELLGIPDEEKQ